MKLLSLGMKVKIFCEYLWLGNACHHITTINVVFFKFLVSMRCRIVYIVLKTNILVEKLVCELYDKNDQNKNLIL